MTQRTFLLALLLGAASAALLAACGGGKSNEPTNAGFVRLVNATAGALDLYDGSSKISAAAANAAAAYVDREPTTHDFIVRSGSDAAPTLTVGVQRQQRYTIVAYTSGDSTNTGYLTDDESAPRTGAAKLRVFHTAAADAGSVDVYLLGSACSGLVGSAAAPVASAVTGLQASYVQVGAAGYHLCVTSQGDKGDLRLDIPAASFADQQIVTLILTRSAGGVLLNGLLLNQQGALGVAPNGSARVRLVADTASGASVSVSVGGVSLGAPLAAAARPGAYTLVGTGTLNLSVTIDGNTTVPVLAQSAQAGGDYSLLLSGAAATPAASLVADDNSVSTSLARPVKLRVFNGVNGATTGASLSLDNALVGSASFGSASTPPSLVPASAALAQLNASVDSTDLLVGSGLTLTANQVYTVFLLGNAGAPKAWLVSDR